MKLKLVLLMCLCFAGSIQNALSADYKTISVEEAVKISLANNFDYKIAELKMKEADERVNAVWGELFPVLESEASFSRQDADKGIMSLSDGSLDLKFVQMKFGINPGTFYNSLQTSRSLYGVSREEMRRVKSDIELQVIKSYFSLILYEEMITLRKEAIALFESNLKDVKNMYSTGSLPRFDFLQAQVELNSQKPLLYAAENDYRTSLDNFNYLLGSSDLYKADFASLERNIEKISYENENQKIEALVSYAMKSRPEIIQIQKKMETAEHKKNLYESYYIWPTFVIGGYYGMTKADPNKVDMGLPNNLNPDLSQIAGDNKWQNNWQVNVSATYRWGSLFRLDSAGAHAREEKLAMQEAAEEMMRLKKRILINISSSYSRLFTAYQTILSEKDNVETANEGFRIARESFKAGVIKNSDLISSQYLLTTAKINYINAINSYYTALAELKREAALTDISIIFE